jgi:hypothetical protein
MSEKQETEADKERLVASMKLLRQTLRLEFAFVSFQKEECNVVHVSESLN